MKNLIALIALSVSLITPGCVTTANAQVPDDRVKYFFSLPQTAHCDIMANLIVEGIYIAAINGNVAEWVENADATQAELNHDYRRLSPHEREFLEAALTLGYDMGVKYKQDIKDSETGEFKGKVADVQIPKHWAIAQGMLYNRKCMTMPYTPTPYDPDEYRDVNFVRVQSQQLDQPNKYYGLEWSIINGLDNLGKWYAKCMKRGGTQNQCKNESWKKFFDDTGLYPKPTITEEVEREVERDV